MENERKIARVSPEMARNVQLTGMLGGTIRIATVEQC